MSVNEIILEFYRRYKFLDLSYNDFSSLVLLGCTDVSNENVVRETFRNNILKYSAEQISKGRETFISLFKKCSKTLNPNDLFDYIEDLYSKYGVEITDEDINYLCDFQYLRKYYDSLLEKENVDDIISSNTILGKVLDLYSIAVEDDKYYVEDTFVNDSLQLFMKDLSNIPVITPDKEKELFIRLANGEDVKNEIIEGNLRLIVKVARHYINKYSSKSIQIQDLIQDGYLGIKSAVEKFDITKGFKFSTYAVWWIKQSITRDLDVHSKTISIPVYKATRMKVLQRAMIRLGITDLDRVNKEELSKVTGFDVKEIEELYALSCDPVSLDKNVSGDDEDKDTILNFISDEKTNGLSFSDVSYEIDKKNDLYHAINMFDYRTSTILRLRYGLDGGKEMSLVDVGKIFGVSRERIRIIEKNALEMLEIILRKYSQDYDKEPLYKDIEIDLSNENDKKTDIHRSFANFTNFMEKIRDVNVGYKVLKFNPFEYTLTIRCNKCGEIVKTTPLQLTKPNYKCEVCSKKRKIKKYQDMLDEKGSTLKLIAFEKANKDASFVCSECGAKWKARVSYTLTRPYCGMCHQKNKGIARTREDK